MIIRINGKLLDTGKMICIYSDGRFSNRGVDVYVTAKCKKLIAVPWSKWQGENPLPSEIHLDDFLKFPHPERVAAGLDQAGIEYQIYDDLD